ncbi:MAG TPA: succinate dehydrogenase assembly factor 2 [Burkholderiales bacterium]|jgi:antitoxin CptB
MLDAAELSRLKWRSRRGMLENDLVMETFFARHESELTPARVEGLQVLLELPDPELWDLVTGRAELSARAMPAVHEMLGWMRESQAH